MDIITLLGGLFEKAWSSLYPGVMVLILAIGYGQSKFLRTWIWSKDAQVDGAWKTAAVSAIIIPVYLIAVQRNGGSEAIAYKALFTYVITTSLYELVIKIIRHKFGKTVKKPVHRKGKVSVLSKSEETQSKP